VDSGKCFVSLKLIAKGGGALLHDDNVHFGHVLVILILPLGGLCVPLLPEIELNVSDRESCVGIIRVRLASRCRGDGNGHGCHVTDGLRYIVSKLKL
jgi:hypothetical protein